jgi:hypothetical protein
MKRSCAILVASSRPPQAGKHRRSRRRAAFTLVEVVMAMGLILLVISAVIGAHLYALRMHELTKPKLSASDEARAAVARLTDEIRSAHLIRVGTGSLASFTEAGPGAPQMGSAIQVYPTLSTNDFIRYFWDGADRKLKRMTNDALQATVVANAVSNAVVFTAEDFAGNVLTNNYNNRVIGLTLQFYQIQYPVMAIGPGNLYDFYQLRTKITRRTLL